MSTRPHDHADDPRGQPRRCPDVAPGPLWVLIVLLLTPPVVIPLLVGLYDQMDPTLAGFPFFFWFQFALILMSAALTVLAYYVAKAADRRDREGLR